MRLVTDDGRNDTRNEVEDVACADGRSTISGGNDLGKVQDGDGGTNRDEESVHEATAYKGCKVGSEGLEECSRVRECIRSNDWPFATKLCGEVARECCSEDGTDKWDGEDQGLIAGREGIGTFGVHALVFFDLSQ